MKNYSDTIRESGTAVAQWLRRCATNGEVAGSIPAGVIGIFLWHKILPIALWPWGRLSFQQKWVPGAFPGGKGGRCVRLTTLPLSCAVFMKSGNLNLLEPSGPLQACNGTALPFNMGNQTRGLPAFNAVPQPTAPPRAPGGRSDGGNIASSDRVSLKLIWRTLTSTERCKLYYSSSIGTTANCGLWSVEQCPSIFSYPPPTLSIFSLPALQDLFLLPLSIISWVFPFFSSLPVLEWRSFWSSYPPPFSLGDLTSLSFVLLSILLYFLLCSSLLGLDSSDFSIPRFHI